jgi:dolichyl-diphosphooligosaccharide--protein glycosyltransferase
MTLARWALAVACALAFALRSLPFSAVFRPGFVNYQETDAWFHVRVMEHLVRHFPFRLFVDPYGSIGDGQRVDTGPFFDWLGALVALPFPESQHAIWAWYPAVLGVGIVVAVFALTRALFDETAAGWAALVAATLPGYFLQVTSLGFTDHHVMEALLSTALLALLVKGRTVWAGLTLGAYLLTFVGGAFLVAVLVGWAAYGFLRWPEERAFAGPLLKVLAIALPLTALANGIIWTEYSQAALAGGLGLLLLAGVCRGWAWPRVSWLGIGLAVAGAGAWLGRERLDVLGFLAPSAGGPARTVAELQSLWFAKGYFSLQGPWQEFGGVYVLVAIALVLLAEQAWRRPEPGVSLLVAWSLAVFVLAAVQLRMLYYLAPMAAVLAGYLFSRVKGQRMAIVILAVAAFGPNGWRLVEAPYSERNGSVPEEWRPALEWLRRETPEPFGDPEAYFSSEVAPASARYGVLSWWDYGYWIVAVGRRVALTNPTQKNGSVAATFFLEEDEAEAAKLMRQWRLRYVAFDAQLAGPLYPAYFPFLRDRKVEEYLLEGWEKTPEGTMQRRRFYRPAYYRSMAARLGRGGRAAEAGGALVVTRDAAGIWTEIREFDSTEEAEREQARCAEAGCWLVGDRPEVPCVRVGALEKIRPVFRAPGTTVSIFELN